MSFGETCSLCGFVALAVVLHAQVAVAEQQLPKGHLEPFGGWKDGAPVEERNDIPGPREFYDMYTTVDGGLGKPVLFRGAASTMKAMEWVSDEFLKEKYAKEKISGVEYNLKETRAGGNVENMNYMTDFVDAYNTSDIYMVSVVPKNMKFDVGILPCMNCGGYLNFLDTPNMWMGRGGSKSVIHYDDQDNINCLFDGQKRFLFMSPKYKKDFEAHPNTKKNKFGWVDSDLSQKVKGYGAFMGKIDIDKVDLIKYPGWSDVDWSYADMYPGDCLYIPFQWYHQVTAAPRRSINVHVWYWRPAKFDDKSCEAASAEKDNFSFGDCTWGFEPKEGGHLGFKSKGGKKLTKCKKTASKKPSGEL